MRPPRRRRRVPSTTDSRHKVGGAANLLKRDFHADAPDRVWLADISEVRTDAGWLHLAAVKDMATMEIVGWAMSDSLKKGLAIDAMRMALQNRRPAPGLVCDSDRGVEQASCDDRRLISAYGAKASMSGKVNCLDNAPVVHAARATSRRLWLD